MRLEPSTLKQGQCKNKCLKLIYLTNYNIFFNNSYLNKSIPSLIFIAVKVCGSGVQDRTVVKDSQITAVSFWDNIEAYQSYHGRLFNTRSWIAGRPAFNQNSLYTK